jgi:hypothetical protein
MCEYLTSCWRYSYSKYLLEKGWPIGTPPPPRLTLLSAKYATIDMLPNKGCVLYEYAL